MRPDLHQPRPSPAAVPGLRRIAIGDDPGFFRRQVRDSKGAVNRALKSILIGLAALLFLGLGASVGIFQYVQSASGQARIQQQLSRALRMPLTFKTASLSAGSFRISGLTVHDGDTARLEAPTICGRYRLWPLLR